MIITTSSGRFRTISRWIKLREKIVTKKSKFYEYGDYVDSTHRRITYFIFNNREMRLLCDFNSIEHPSMFYDDGESYGCINYVDKRMDTREQIENPDFLELDYEADRVRLYKEVSLRI